MRARAALFPAICLAVCLVAPAAHSQQDILGVYFDQDATVTSMTTSTPYQSVPVYIVLVQPSEPSGVAGWEARIAAASAVELPPVGWTYHGSGINFTTPPDFQVGLGAPLPWAPAVVLASGTLLVPSPADEVEFRVGPLREPSLVEDGYPVQAPAYTAGDNPSLILPLTPASGCETTPVAFINDDGMESAVELTCSASQLDFGIVPVGVGTIRSFTVRCTGDQRASFEASVDPGAFLLQILGGQWSERVSAGMQPGQVVTVSVMVIPPSPGGHEATVHLRRCGAEFAAVGLSAGVALPPSCELEPAALDFGNLIVGMQGRQSVRVYNHGGTELTVSPTCACPDFVVAPSTPRTIAAGTSYVFDVIWTPQTGGEVSCAVDLGTEYCEQLVCTGTAMVLPPVCTLSPQSLDFGTLAPGQTVARSFIIMNVGGGALTGTVPTACGPFQVTGGAGTFSLGPLGTRAVTVSITGADPGTFTCDLDLDGFCADVPCTATVEVTPAQCRLSATLLDFQSWVPVGGSYTRSFRISNDGGLPLSGEIEADCAAFTVSPLGPYTVAPGAYLLVNVTFHPTARGTYTCPVTVTPCGAVQCQGETWTSGDWDEDQVGIFWDGSGQRDCLSSWEAPPFQIQTAYLCLLNPTGNGIAGWEARVSWQGPVEVLGWQLQGTGPINIETPPSFMVGLGVPFPQQGLTVLATAQVLPLDAGDTFFYLYPLLNHPSLPGYCCYADGVDPGILIPMLPVHGPDLPVAGIGPSCSVVSTIGTAPTAEIVAAGTGGAGNPGILLRWRYDPDQGDGCHVYRREAGAAEVRLTGLPLGASDGRVEFLDEAAGVAAGTGLSYQFALLRDGREVARSGEVELTWAPPAPSALVLHPCRPNPFNPQTTVVFELPRAGSVRLTVHDLAGRLVRTLLDGRLPAGAHQEIWTGIDQSGRRVPSGTYYCRLATDQGQRIVKMTLLK